MIPSSVKITASDAEINRAAAYVFGADPGKVQSKSRKRELVNMRKSLAYIYHRLNGESQHKVGVKLNMDHATVLYNVRKCEQHYELEKDWRLKIDRLISCLANLVEDNELGHA